MTPHDLELYSVYMLSLISDFDFTYYLPGIRKKLIFTIHNCFLLQTWLFAMLFMFSNHFVKISEAGALQLLASKLHPFNYPKHLIKSFFEIWQ